MLTIYNDATAGSTVISNLFIDEYMKQANDAQIKIYLWLLRTLGSGRATSVADMADEFNHTEKEVIRSLRYWEKVGLLSIECDSCGNLSGIHMLEPAMPVSETAPVDSRVISIAPVREEKALDSKNATVPAATGKGSREAIDEEALSSFREDKKRQDLLFVVEQYVGKPLSVSELQTVCYISENLKFSDELIDYLVQYCVDRGKKDFRYIEKVALNWSEKGITTPKQASMGTAEKRKQSSSASVNRSRQGSFSHFEQRDYDWNALEKKILNS